MTLQEYVDLAALLVEAFSVTAVLAFIVFVFLFVCFMLSLGGYIKYLEWRNK